MIEEWRAWKRDAWKREEEQRLWRGLEKRAREIKHGHPQVDCPCGMCEILDRLDRLRAGELD